MYVYIYVQIAYTGYRFENCYISFLTITIYIYVQPVIFKLCTVGHSVTLSCLSWFWVMSKVFFYQLRIANNRYAILLSQNIITLHYLSIQPTNLIALTTIASTTSKIKASVCKYVCFMFLAIMSRVTEDQSKGSKKSALWLAGVHIYSTSR